ncbi:unnamed protein product [Bursaphelenchus okinawaensis]|uniref:Uncharacterized protein n=1 Tax=Bursaphelenchus okinawaensis TaxID=465554 RepID=A0A811LJY2_9BILA|nr:unnamed protein product [Bursaphelenchus okinawaensis]CAG9124624.1 unnamed protein product [Bursaphelenchus okinawaensis]
MSYHATKVAKTTIGQAAKVQKLENDSQSTNKSFVLKLTAECQKAIERAIQMGWPVRMVSTKTEVKVEVGISDTSVATFTCNQQRLNGDIDAVSQGQSLKKVSPLNTKLVINATNNSFAAAQQKVVKMAELQSQKQTKNKDTKISDSSRKRSAETSSRNKNDFATPIRPASKKTKKSDMADTKTSSKVKGKLMPRSKKE